MSRNIAAATLTAIGAEVVTRAVAVEIIFDSAPLRVCSAPFSLTIDGNTYLGVGGLGSVSALDEAAELQSVQLQLTLTGIPRDQVNEVMAETSQNRAVTVYEVILDGATLAIIGSAIPIFRGRIDTAEIALGESATVTLTVTNRLADWERPANRLYSDEEQQRTHTGDLGFQYAAGLEGKNVRFPAAAFFKDQPQW